MLGSQLADRLDCCPEYCQLIVLGAGSAIQIAKRCKLAQAAEVREGGGGRQSGRQTVLAAMKHMLIQRWRTAVTLAYHWLVCSRRAFSREERVGSRTWQ